MRQKWLQKPPLGTPINCSHPSAKGLVLDLEFQEGGGDVANDLSGNANHGVLKNMAFPPTATSGWNPGKFGACPKFDGTDDYVDVNNSDLFNFGDSFTDSPFSISAWVFSANYDQLGAIVEKYGEYILRFSTAENGVVYFNLYDNSPSASLYTTSSDIGGYDNQWLHICGIYDGSGSTDGIKLYINGVLDSTPSSVNYTAMHNESTVLTIGQRKVISEKYFQGQIDQVRIYNRALSAEEVLDSYVNSFARFERTKWGLLVPSPVSGLSIPVAMHNYRRMRA